MDFSTESYYSGGDCTTISPSSSAFRHTEHHDVEVVIRRRKKLTIVRPEAAETKTQSVESLFDDLTQRWKRETALLSSPSEIAMNPAYQRIIGIGPRALPLIFAEIKLEPDWWFWALRSITGTDPVSAANRGKLNAMTNAWLEWWGKHSGQEYSKEADLYA